MVQDVVGSSPISHPKIASVAQLDRALDFGSRCWGFKSSRGYKKGIENEEGFTKLYGTPQYIPPEILKCNNGRGDKGGNNLFYNEQCDMFSLGVVLFECFTGGTPPFIFSPEYLHADDENKNTYYEEIRNFEQDKSKTGFTKKHIQSASEEFKDILKGLLKEIPKERITASEALQHAFFKT